MWRYIALVVAYYDGATKKLVSLVNRFPVQTQDGLAKEANQLPDGHAVNTGLSQPLTNAQLLAAALATEAGQAAIFAKLSSDPATQTTLAAFKAEAKTESDDSQVILTAIKAAVEVMDDWDESDRAKINAIVGQAGVEAGAGLTTAKTQRMVMATDQAPIPIVGTFVVPDVIVVDKAEVLEFKDGITVSTVDQEIIAASAGTARRDMLIHVPPAAGAAVHFNAGAPATQATLPVPPGGTFKANSRQSIHAVVDGNPGVAVSTTPDASSFDHVGTLVGTTLPNLIASVWAGFGNMLNFIAGGVNFGSSQDYALRGNTKRSFESVIRSKNPDSYYRMNEAAGNLIDQIARKPYRPRILATPGLGSYWRLGEAAGNFADSGPAAIPGVPSGLTRGVASVITPAQAEGDLAVAGPGSIDFGQNYKFLGRQSFSVEWWVSETTIGNDEIGCISGSVVNGDARGWLVGLSTLGSGNAAIQIFRQSGSIIELVAAQFDYRLHPRLHVVATYDGVTGLMSLYAQAQLLGTIVSTIEILTNASPLTLTLDAATSKSDELAIYPDTVLTPAQIQERFTFGTSAIGGNDGVVTGNVTRNAPSLVTPNQNNPFGDANGALQLNDATATVSTGTEAYRFGGKPLLTIMLLKSGTGTLRYGNMDTVAGWEIVWGATSVIYRRRNGAALDTVTAPFVTAPLSAAIGDDGTQASIYLDGVLVVTSVVTQAIALNTVNLLLQSTAGAVVADEPIVLLRALSAAEILELHTAATEWDGGRPRNFDIRHRPDILQSAVVAARENATELDWSLETLVGGTHRLRYFNENNAVETLSGGAYAAASLEVMRVTDDRTVVSIQEIIAGVPTTIASSYVRPHPDTAAIETYVGRNAKTVDVSQFDGAADELRVSRSVRSDAGAAPYVNDADTLALHHFDTITVTPPGTAPPDVTVYVVLGE